MLPRTHRPTGRRFSRARGGWLALSIALGSRAALGCPCNLVAGPSAPLTQPSERWGFSAGLSLLRELGTFDARGGAHPNPPAVRSDRATWDVGAAHRPTPRLELGLSTSLSVTALDLPGASLRERALGDVLTRGRYDFRTLADPGPWPAVALSATVRLPTGTASSSGSSASFAPGIGLGAWEFSLGVDLRKNLGERFQLNLAVDGALRASEADRVPGPRVMVAASGMYLPTSRWAFAAAATAWWEGAARADGGPVQNSWLYRTTVSITATVRLSGTLRCAAGASVDPPAEGFGRNTVSTLRGSLVLAWSR